MPVEAHTLQPIFSSPKEMNDLADQSILEGIAKQFPVESKHFRVEVSDLRAEKRHFSHVDEKDAILQSKSLTYPIKGHVKLVDTQTGQVVDENKNFTLMDSFHITGKHTMLYKGNNYSAANQLQLLPGVYTRRRSTGELESHFNTKTGRTFALTLNPENGMFYVSIGDAKTPLAVLLNEVFHVSSAEVAKYVPSDVWQQNIVNVKGKELTYLNDLFNRLVSTHLRNDVTDKTQKVLLIKEALENSQLHVKTTEKTLGKSFTHVNAEALLLAMRNIVEVHSGKRQEDNRDSLEFKRVQNLPDFLKTRFEKERDLLPRIRRKIAGSLNRLDRNNPSLKYAVTNKPFNKVFTQYIMDSNLVSTPSETNPIESLESVGKVTVLGAGEGGISSTQGVPMAARDIDPSHLGVIDPSRTPESQTAGIDQRFTISARRDRDGTLYSKAKDKSGKTVYLSVQEMMSHTIGFPHQEGKKLVQAQAKGELTEVPVEKVDYWLFDTADMYTITTNLVPFLNSNHPGRLTMAGKAIPQALSLVHREAPLVQTVNGHGQSFAESLGKVIGTISPVDGEVVAVTDAAITIRDEQGKLNKILLVKNLPYNMKGFLDDEKVLVKVGEKVKRGQNLADNNYTRNGTLALGKNMTVAYVPYKGYNHEDGIVISRAAAKGLDSHHAYKYDYDVQETTVAKKVMFNRFFPGKYSPEQLAKLDDNGYAKKDAKLHFGDPVFAVLERREPTPEDKMLGRLHKTLVNPYKAVVEEWTHEEPGEVVDAFTASKSIRILIRSVKALEVGDKLTGLHGNKGVISKILEDHEMPFHTATGKPVDLLLNPASVTSRINLGQIAEVAAAKIAQKTGEPYKVHNFKKESNFSSLQAELKAHGLKDTEHLTDPISGKPLGEILTGPQYILKLYKTTDQNWSARNVGKYDSTHQPVKGGEEGSKSVGYMEMLGLLGSDARKNLREISTLKSEENSEYWKKYLTGQPLPKPKTTFATQKFFNYLTASGIKTQVKDGALRISPLTNADILQNSRGSIKEPLMLNSKNLEPEKGGLFDPVVTGGLQGKNWAHYSLSEPILNPVFERPARSLLGLTTKELKGVSHGTIGIRHISNGVFDLHDTTTGKHLKRLNTKGSLIADADLDEDDDSEVDDSAFDPAEVRK